MVAFIIALIYVFIEWLNSKRNQLKHFESTLRSVSIGILIITIVLFYQIIFITLIQTSGVVFWSYLVVTLGVLAQAIENIMGLFRSKRKERMFINTVNHLINTSGQDKFSMSELEEATKIEYEDEIRRLFNLSQKHGYIPNNIVLYGQSVT